MAKSRDAFRTISEVADWLDTPAHVLRFWESKFTQVKPVKRAGGRRYYRPEDMALLGGIKKLLHEDGLTIKGVQKMLREQGVKHVSALADPNADAQDSSGDVVEHDSLKSTPETDTTTLANAETATPAPPVEDEAKTISNDAPDTVDLEEQPYGVTLELPFGDDHLVSAKSDQAAASDDTEAGDDQVAEASDDDTEPQATPDLSITNVVPLPGLAASAEGEKASPALSVNLSKPTVKEDPAPDTSADADADDLPPDLPPEILAPPAAPSLPEFLAADPSDSDSKAGPRLFHLLEAANYDGLRARKADIAPLLDRMSALHARMARR